MAAEPQIRQMVNFIYAEAHEKANEIRIQTENAFNRDKLTMVQNERKKINEEYLRKEKQQIVQQRVDRSRQVGDLRLGRMQEREQQLTQLREETMGRLGSISSSGQYEKIMTALIIQGMMKIGEDDVQILCRQQDTDLVRRIKDKALSEFNAKVQERYGKSRNVTLSVGDMHLDDGCQGGVVLTAYDGRIRCDNTLATRLNLALEELLPQVRTILYPNSKC